MNINIIIEIIVSVIILMGIFPSTHTIYQLLNLGKFVNDGTFSLTFGKPGIYGYHNHLNPNQTGSIIVQ